VERLASDLIELATGPEFSSGSFFVFRAPTP